LFCCSQFPHEYENHIQEMESYGDEKTQSDKKDLSRAYFGTIRVIFQDMDHTTRITAILKPIVERIEMLKNIEV